MPFRTSTPLTDAEKNQAEYRKAMAQKAAERGNSISDPIQNIESAGEKGYKENLLAPDTSTPSPSAKEDNPYASMAQTGADTASAGASQGSGLSTLGGGLMAAGAIPSPASPYLIGAGVVANMAGAAEQNHRNQINAQRESYNARIAQRQQMMQNIAQMRIS